MTPRETIAKNFESDLAYLKARRASQASGAASVAMTLDEAWANLCAIMDEPGDSLSRSLRLVDAFHECDHAAAELKAITKK